MNISKLMTLLDSLSDNWFLSSESCLEAMQAKKIFVNSHSLNVGIYCDRVQAESIIAKLPHPEVLYVDDTAVEMTFLLDCRVHLFLFIDYHGYIVEMRNNLLTNRYRTLCYDSVTILAGTELVSLENGINIRMLKKSEQYCRSMYGNGFMNIRNMWDRWNGPKNVLWEDFIQKPIPLV